MKLQDIPEDIEPRVGDILEIEQGDVCFEVRIIGITADGYLCEQDNVQGAVLLEGSGLDEADATDIEDFLRSGGRVERIPYKNTRKEKGAAFRFGSKHIGAAGGSGKGKQISGLGAATSAKGNKPVVTAGYDPELDEEKVRLDPKCWKGKKIGNPKTKMKGGVRVNNCVPEGQEDIEESGLQYYTGVKKHGKKYMKLAAKAGREGASQEELGRLKDRYSKAEKTSEGRFDEPLTGWHIVYRNSGNPVHATPSFETKEQAQKYLMTKMFANHQDFKVVHTAGVGVAEGYTGRETKDGTWRVFKDGKAVAAAGPFKSREEAAAWIKKQKQGVQEGAEEHEYSLSMGNRQRPGSDRLDTDSRSRMDSLRAQEHDLKQRTIDILLKRHPTWERSDLELASLPELIDMLRMPTTKDMDEAKYQGREVPLGKKMAGDVKKSKVYVRKPNGKVVKVNFGDKNMTIKKSNPARRKSFRARHNCDNPGPRWKARYWSCRSW